MNCTVRTKINFLAALSWAYSSGIKESAGVPMIATNRPGAWMEALELGMRMRNLEMIANRPPAENMNFETVSSMSSIGASVGLNERPVKAFTSAFRNLGGGKYKDKLLGGSGGSGNSGIEELAATFRLTEIAPQPFDAPALSTSGFLIPDFEYPGTSGITARQKHYVDLQIVPVNYATMFSNFSPAKNEIDAETSADATCFISKTALPVPGYIMGFVKNPAVVTYYAVKGEAQFTGLFFPRTSDDQPGNFKLTAYAAAKPFGGRIGPKIFGFDSSQKAIVSRSDEFSSSTPFYSGLDLGVAGDGASAPYVPGDPIPASSDFWANKTTTQVGGIPEENTRTRFGIPNMIYDFESEGDLAVQTSGNFGTLFVISPQLTATSDTKLERGLYHSTQIRKLYEALGGSFEGQNMSSDDLMRAIVRARQVTKYDAANYLVPNIARPTSGEKTNVAPTVRSEGAVPGGIGVYYKLFAPLLGENTLYPTSNMVVSVINSYKAASEDAVNNYLQALLNVGKRLYNLKSAQVGSPVALNQEAALNIHPNSGRPDNVPTPAPFASAGDPLDENAPGCRKDMASKFYHFFTKSNTECGIIPLEALAIEYIDKKNTGDGNLYFRTTYLNQLPIQNIMTAYYPGERQGTDTNAIAKGPIGTQTDNYSTRRNFYSTKFVPLSKLMASSSSFKEDVFLESNDRAPQDIQGIIPQNPIQGDSTTGLNNSYYLDF